MESIASIQKLCEKYENAYFVIKSKSKQLFEDFKDSLSQLEKCKKTVEEKRREVLRLHREVSLKDDQLSSLQEKLRDIRRTETELQFYRNSLKSMKHLSIDNEM